MLLDQPQQGGVSNAIEDKVEVDVGRSSPVGWYRRCIHVRGYTWDPVDGKEGQPENATEHRSWEKTGPRVFA